jgi:hypothetical protein
MRTQVISTFHAGPLDYYDAKPEPLREDPLTLALQLPRTDLDRNDGCQQPNQRRSLQAHSARYSAHPDEFGHWYVG